MKKIAILVILVFCLSIFNVLADEGITKAVPTNFKSKCTAGFIGEKFCEKDAVHQYYQNDVCFKYDKILETCTDEQVCDNGACVARRNNEITGDAVSDVESQGFFSKIIAWFKSLF